MAISSSNTGGAWDNAKKYIESGQMKKLIEGTNQPSQISLKKHSEELPCPEHQAAVVGDTCGEPAQGHLRPLLNILVKLMAILSLVFADAVNQYGGKIFGIQSAPISPLSSTQLFTLFSFDAHLVRSAM